MKQALFGALIWLLSTPVAFAVTKKDAVDSKDSKDSLGSNDWFFGELPELGLRLARVFSIVVAIFFICSMLSGAFQQIISSGKDEEVREARRKITIGFFGTLAMLLLYFAASSALGRLEK